ncbi:MAG TPA: DNA cytosine methyltransferase [Ktedonobacteraceae bacterium]
MVSTEHAPLSEEHVTTAAAKSSRRQKLSRIRDGGIPRVLDLFAGCGGLSLGFQAAGCEIVGAVEFDPIAAQSHAFNFYKNAGALQGVHGKVRDITIVEPQELVSELEMGSDVATCWYTVLIPLYLLPCAPFLAYA